MYKAKILSKSINHPARQYTVEVEFTDGTNTIVQKMPFGFDIDLETVKQTIKRYATALSTAEQSANNVPVGDVDLATVTEPTVTRDEQAFADWMRNFTRLQNVQQLIACGVFTGTETPIVNLRNKVRTDFKPTFIDYL